MQKNEEFEIEIIDYSSEGLGIGKSDSFVWFIKDTVIGDRVRAAATKVKRNYGFARMVELLKPSEARTKAPCAIAKQCGGCQLQQMRYEDQLRFKADKVRNNMLRIGLVEPEILDMVSEPIVGMSDPFRYRNKAQFPISKNRDGRIIAGFYASRTHQVIECEDCLLGIPENKEILDIVINWMNRYHIEPYDEISGRGIVRHVMIRKGFKSGELMVCLVINAQKLQHSEELVEELKKFGAGSISMSINTERGNVIMGKKIISLYGETYIEDMIGPVKFRISPLSFYQVNPVQTENMYGAALDFAELTDKDNVLDLYCGIGTISLFMARKAHHVYGIEIVPEAIEDAKCNAEINGIKNADFYAGAAEEVLPKWYEEHPSEKIDVVCVDPPRKGCDETCLATITSIAPDRIVYVSCDSATLARDVNYLRNHGYELKKVRPVDNFPETVHVETVVLMSRKDK